MGISYENLLRCCFVSDILKFEVCVVCVCRSAMNDMVRCLTQKMCNTYLTGSIQAQYQTLVDTKAASCRAYHPFIHSVCLSLNILSVCDAVNHHNPTLSFSLSVILSLVHLYRYFWTRKI